MNQIRYINFSFFFILLRVYYIFAAINSISQGLVTSLVVITNNISNSTNTATITTTDSPTRLDQDNFLPTTSTR